MPTWTPPDEQPKRREPPPPKHHRPPHAATHEGLAHVSEQIEEIRNMIERLDARIAQMARG